MAKKYLNENVYEAAQKRITIAFNEFDKVLVSLSGGKDSSVLVQLTNDIAKKLNKKFYVMFLDQECISQYTSNHIEELKQLSNIEKFFHICLPFEEDNAVSQFNPQWIMWDKDIEDKWVRERAKDAVIEEYELFDFFYKGMADFEFYPKFAEWLANGESLANIIGIRSQESLNRWRTIARDNINRYKDLKYTVVESENVVKFYPIYDWVVADVWHCVFKNDYKYNYLYELMTKDGIPFSDQRICQPFGLEQRRGLDLFAKFEPELWDKLVNRVSGANYGALYARTEMLGHLGTSKPDHMNWEQYTCFLIESLALQYPEIADQYVEKIKTAIKYHKEKYNQDVTDETIEKAKEYISWQFISRAVEKNDYWMKRLSFAETKKGYERLERIAQKYNDIL